MTVDGSAQTRLDGFRESEEKRKHTELDGYRLGMDLGGAVKETNVIKMHCMSFSKN